MSHPKPPSPLDPDSQADDRGLREFLQHHSDPPPPAPPNLREQIVTLAIAHPHGPSSVPKQPQLIKQIGRWGWTGIAAIAAAGLVATFWPRPQWTTAEQAELEDYITTEWLAATSDSTSDSDTVTVLTDWLNLTDSAY